jgi:hypothetical protein
VLAEFAEIRSGFVPMFNAIGEFLFETALFWRS